MKQILFIILLLLSVCAMSNVSANIAEDALRDTCNRQCNDYCGTQPPNGTKVCNQVLTNIVSTLGIPDASKSSCTFVSCKNRCSNTSCCGPNQFPTIDPVTCACTCSAPYQITPPSKTKLY